MFETVLHDQMTSHGVVKATQATQIAIFLKLKITFTITTKHCTCMQFLGKANSTSRHDKSTHMYVCSLLERPITLPSEINQITCMYVVHQNCQLCFQPQQTTYMYVVSWKGQSHFQALQIKLHVCMVCMQFIGKANSTSMLHKRMPLHTHTTSLANEKITNHVEMVVYQA